MRSGADSPYWLRKGFRTLTSSKWDILIFMLGTNDAKDRGSHGAANWMHDCIPEAPLACQFSRDYAAMLRLFAHLGRHGPPKIYLMVPPPLLEQGAYGMNQSVINHVLPKIVPAFLSAPAADVPPITGLVDLFAALGGHALAGLGPKGCTLNTSRPSCCAYFCDKQSCDQCHPNDVGYALLARTVRDVLASSAT